MMAAMAERKKTLYEILAVGSEDNTIDFGLAYRRRMAELQKAVPQDASEIALVHEAYEVLNNPKRRAAYDDSLMARLERDAAAEQAHAPDLVLEPEPAAPAMKPVWAGVGAGIVVIAAALFFTLRDRAPAAPPKEVVEAPKPAASLPPPPPKPLTAADILAGATSSVGRVISYDMAGRATPLGLALAVDRGVFVTTCHGLPAGSQLVVRIGLEPHSATLAMNDEELDLCKLAVPDSGGSGLPIATDDLKAGDKIYALGANAKGELALTEGTVKQIRPSPIGKVIEVSMPIAPTASGGALFDAYGRLAGVTTTPHTFGAGLEIALPASWISQLRSRARNK